MIQTVLHKVFSYLKFFWKSKNEHGVHSPFVFELVTKCFYDKKKYPEYKLINEYRNKLLANNNTLEVTDFGAGSKVFNSNTRKISLIVKNAGISAKKALLLYRIVQYFKPDTVLEIGTSVGLAISAISVASSNSKITSLEGCKQTQTVAKNMFQEFGWENTQFITTEFSVFFKNPDLKTKKYQLIYFDGNHSKKATLDYFEQLLPTVSNESVWIFDDIHWNKEMEIAWEIIQKRAEVSVSIDIYQWGLVFFRKEQRKEHFVIRV
jgi:predicted O-methyltransferase YrrM